MRETTFVKKNIDKWEKFENLLKKKRPNPDQLANLFIDITDDLAYARTNYPRGKTTAYLNNLAAKVHQSIYRNRRETGSRIISFWLYELPQLFRSVHKEFFYSFLIFFIACVLGALSTAYDDHFARLILGDGYVNMTLRNIENGDPMAVYKGSHQNDMFFAITMNNIRVAFNTFALGLLFSFGTGYFLMVNGFMLGTFQFFFYQKGLLWTSVLSIWIHGTLEISAIIIAGAAGFALGNSILFPRTYSRMESFRQGASKGIKIIVGLVPIFIIAGFLESFVTRLTEAPILLKLLIIGGSAAFIVYYFIIYPIKLDKRAQINPVSYFGMQEKSTAAEEDEEAAIAS
jgi:uncharacterized membrane protein SpoIIM required for sporulation